MIPVFVPAPVMPQAAAAYAGPGNVISGASAWWGLRGYSAAAVGANAVQLRRDSDNVVPIFRNVNLGLNELIRKRMPFLIR